MLLAKSVIEGRKPKTLAAHCQDVVDSFSSLFGTSDKPTRLGKEWLRFFKLPSCLHEKFFRCGEAASGLHDLGKANTGFQGMVSPGTSTAKSQAIRHEHLSGLLLVLPDTKKWLASIPNIDLEVVLSAIISHHLKAGHETFGQYLDTAEKALFTVLEKDPEFPVIFEQVVNRLGGTAFTGKVPSLWSLDGKAGFYALPLKSEICSNFERFKRELKKQPERQRLLLAVKMAVIVADSAGSGLPRNDLEIVSWIEHQFREESLLSDQYIEEEIIQPRIKQIEAKTNKPFQRMDFQIAAGQLPSRALVLASCGSGKTLAAWYWIQNQLKQRPAARVIFLYPTRATATEGFKDYVSWAPEADAALVSGTAAYELEGLFSQPGDERGEKDYTVEARLYSLAFWQRRVFSATVDQFLGFMQHAYGSVCLLPVLADSVVVFDEIHSFDPKLFSTLKQFLGYFDVPVLCMTASLPTRRREELIQLGLTPFPGEEKYPELDALANHPRYTVKVIADDFEAEDIATQAVKSGKRVLWVVNTVDRCQQLAKSLKPYQALCYHSRFTLNDRKHRHQKVISAFQQKAVAVIAVTTQVCEMSLDLDCDVLITETAPITALIQRMGRCNRHARPHEEQLGKIFVYQAESVLPYDAEHDLTGVVDFVQALANKEVSQSALEELLEKFGPREKEKRALCRFLDDGPWATSEPLREIENRTVQAVLEHQVEEYLQLTQQRKPTDGLILSIPVKLGEKDYRLGKYLFRASSSHYLPDFGFFNEPQGSYEIH